MSEAEVGERRFQNLDFPVNRLVFELFETLDADVRIVRPFGAPVCRVLTPRRGYTIHMNSKCASSLKSSARPRKGFAIPERRS